MIEYEKGSWQHARDLFVTLSLQLKLKQNLADPKVVSFVFTNRMYEFTDFRVFRADGDYEDEEDEEK